MSRRAWASVRLVSSGLIFGVLLWRLGTTPFFAGLSTVSGGALLAAAGLAVLTTVCCAWRWKLVAGGLGLDLSLAAAVAAYYRSQFLNLTLPGGVVGDVHRGVCHGREVSDVARALGAVACERFAGQLVQALITVVVLLVLPSPVHASMPVVASAVVVGGLVVALTARARRGGARSLWARIRRASSGGLRDARLTRGRWLGIVLASAVVVAGHALTFLIAARVAGTSAPPSRMLPIALLVLLAGVIPSVGGWGPREGVTAWVFGAAGLDAHQGVATAVAFGVMVLVASLPGAVVLVLAWLRGPRLSQPTQPMLRHRAAHA